MERGPRGEDSNTCRHRHVLRLSARFSAIQINCIKSVLSRSYYWEHWRGSSDPSAPDLQDNRERVAGMFGRKIEHVRKL